MSLDMIKKACMWDNERFGTTRNTVLAEDHFYKNAYPRIRIHLAVQVVSELVAVLIDLYINEIGVDMVERYAPLKSLVLECNRLVDIWNANYSKKCEFINSSTHAHVKKLHSILLLFDTWKNVCKTKDEFITNESWDIYLLVGVWD